jgi:hypothetical protein
MTTFLRVFSFLACAVVATSGGWAQDNAPGQSSGAPAAATGPAAVDPDNPPLSDLDVPTSETPFTGRSFFIPGLQFDEAIDSNGYGGSNGSSQTITEVSQGLGSIDLQKIWRRYQVGLDYVAGGSYITGPNPSGLPRGYQTHSFGSDQRILWRTGQLSIRDTFMYLPEGTFGFGSYGGFGGFSSAMGGSGLSGVGLGSGLGGGIAGGTPGGLYGSGQFGTIGIQPRIDNVAIIDVAQGISPRSTVTIGGGYDFSEYLDKSRSNFPLVNSQVATGQIGFNRLISRKDQIALVAVYQQIQFPGGGGGGVHAYVFQARYGHRISGKLDLVIAGGPQVTTVNTIYPILGGNLAPIPSTTSISGNGSVTLGYNVSARTSVHLDYQHFLTPGSGFYAGANTDALRVSVSHLLSRNLTFLTDNGWTYNTPLQSRSTNNGINASSYQYWYLSASLRRMVGQHLGVFATYQFYRFLAGSCSSSSASLAVCGNTYDRHVGVIGLSWHPRPIRLD